MDPDGAVRRRAHAGHGKQQLRSPLHNCVIARDGSKFRLVSALWGREMMPVGGSRPRRSLRARTKPGARYEARGARCEAHWPARARWRCSASNERANGNVGTQEGQPAWAGRVGHGTGLGIERRRLPSALCTIGTAVPQCPFLSCADTLTIINHVS